MSTVHKTPTALLIDMELRKQYGEGVVETVLRLTDEGLSSRAIAVKLHEWTGIRISHETVRVWEFEWRHQTGAAA